jgi:ketosteroid isomerase-like protein
MSESEANERLLRATIAAYNREDEDGVVAGFAPTIECHVSSALLNAGTWQGIDGYRELIAGWDEAWKERRMDVLEVEAPDERHVIARIDQRGVGVGSGVPVELEIFVLFEVADGRAVRLHVYADRESAIAAVS